MKIYVASSWRNPYQQDVVAQLRTDGFDVYDFQHPPGGDHLGFSWSDVDLRWTEWGIEDYMLGLTHPIAQAGFDSDFDAMQSSDACVLVLPCGRSAHLEAGYFVGAGKPLYILLDEREFDHETAPQSPHSRIELMYKMATLVARYYGPIRDALRLERMTHQERPDSDLVSDEWQAGYDAAITDTFGVEPDDAELAHERTIETDFARAQFLAADRAPLIGQDTAATAQYMTLDETTQRARPMTDEEIAELSAKVLPPEERLPLDMSDEIGDDTRIESTIDSRQ